MKNWNCGHENEAAPETSPPVKVARVGKTRGGTAKERKLEREVDSLKDYIRRDGMITDSCTYDILREICGNCRCKRALVEKEMPRMITNELRKQGLA